MKHFKEFMYFFFMPALILIIGIITWEGIWFMSALVWQAGFAVGGMAYKEIEKTELFHPTSQIITDSSTEKVISEINKTGRRQRKPVHPGVILKNDFLDPLGISISDGSKMLGVSTEHLSKLTSGSCKLTPEIARKVANITNTSVESWLAMQNNLTMHENKYTYKNKR